jgi:hypothetical protein
VDGGNPKREGIDMEWDVSPLTRLAGAGAALALGSTLMVGAATSAQAAVANYRVINGNSSDAYLQVTVKTGGA